MYLNAGGRELNVKCILKSIQCCVKVELKVVLQIHTETAQARGVFVKLRKGKAISVSMSLKLRQQ